MAGLYDDRYQGGAEQAVNAAEQAYRHGGALGLGEDPDSYYALPAKIHDEIPPRVARYLIAREKPGQVYSMHLHPVILWKETAAVLLGLALAAALNSWLYVNDAATPRLVHLLWISWLVVVCWYAERAAAWRATWFVITPVRLILISGLFRRSVTPLPIKRARDVEMQQPFLGAWLRYGTLVIPSFGTEHALSYLERIPEVQTVANLIWELLLPAAGASPMPEEVQ